MPATVTLQNTTTVTSFSGGVTAVAGTGIKTRVIVGGAWAVGDKFTCEIVTPSQTYDFGIGRMTGLVPVAAVTLYDRVHFVAGSFWNGSDNGDATAWEQQAPGAFQINIANQSQQPEDLLALSSFQGKMALFSRRTIEVWAINADPTLIAQVQVLSNIGIVAPSSAQSLGDLDVLFPADSGCRSLRVQTINLNAFISDIGSPIDLLIQAAVQGQTTTQLKGITAVVEPVNNRYMIYFPNVGTNGTIYILSYFPTAKIIAWSEYIPAFDTNTTTRTPSFFSLSTFKVFSSVVFYRGKTSVAGQLPNGASSFIGSYGASNADPGWTYDLTQPIVEMPWLDLKKAVQVKTATQIDYVVKSQWSFSGSLDFNGVNAGGPLKDIALNVNPTTNWASSQQTGSVDWSDEGYNVLIKAVGTNPLYPGTRLVLSELVFHYTTGDNK